MKNTFLFLIFLLTFQINLKGQQLYPLNLNLAQMEYSSVDWSDYDRDGDLDLLMIGATAVSSNGAVAETTIFRCDGNKFTRIEAGLPGFWYGTARWGDYDNDGDPDIFMMGFTTGSYETIEPYSKIYRNDGNNLFTEINAGLMNLFSMTPGCAEWEDFDMDGDLDLLITGMSFNNPANTLLYRNDRNDNFTRINHNFVQVFNGSVDWADYDYDGDPDLLITGLQEDFSSVTKIYQNHNGTFTDINAEITPIAYGVAIWGNMDGDNDLDILISGQYYPRDTSGVLVTEIYEFNGSFKKLNHTFPGLRHCSADWGDYNLDGKPDFVLTGEDGFSAESNKISRVYKNMGQDQFIQASEILAGTYLGESRWVDYDGDGDLDLNISGSGIKTMVYENKIYTPGNIKKCDYIQIVYPNPGNKEVLIKLKGSNSLSLLLEIFNTSGKKIMSRIIHDSNPRIDISSLPNGPYCISISHMGQSCQYIIIKSD